MMQTYRMENRRETLFRKYVDSRLFAFTASRNIQNVNVMLIDKAL